MKLTSVQKMADERAVYVTQQYLKREWQVVEALIEVNRTKTHRALQYTSLVKYAIERLKLADATAKSLVSVARKSKDVPALGEAVRSRTITAYTACRMVAAINNENAKELIEFARTHSTRDLEFEVRRHNPKATVGDSVKPVTADLLQVTVLMTKEEFAVIERTQDLMSKNSSSGLKETIVATCLDYNQRHDPVQKAKRAQKRKKVCAPRIFEGTAAKRVRLTAEQKHAVFVRDGGQCTFKDSLGKRCENRRWLEVHHIIHVKDGGTNDPENLPTLCSCHHDLAHQLTLPLEGQISWLRSPIISYGLH